MVRQRAPELVADALLEPQRDLAGLARPDLADLMGDAALLLADLQVVRVLAVVLKLDQRRARTDLGPRQRQVCLLYTSPSPRDGLLSRMPSSA